MELYNKVIKLEQFEERLKKV